MNKYSIRVRTLEISTILIITTIIIVVIRINNSNGQNIFEKILTSCELKLFVFKNFLWYFIEINF